MHREKTAGIAFVGLASSLERAQRVNAPRGHERGYMPGMSNEFIRPMWISPEELKQRRQQNKNE